MKRLDVFIMLVLFTSSAALRLLLVTGFDGLYGQDSYAYFDFAQNLQRFATSGQTLPAFFWPIGYPALLAAGFTLLGAQAVVGQTINIMLGALLSPLVYALSRQMEIRRFGALTAALVVAVCGQALQSSVVLMSDIPALAWAALSTVSLWRYIHTGKTRWLAASASLLALASITRWLYLLLFFIWGLTLLLTWKGRIRRREIAASTLAALIVFLPQLAYSGTNPNPALNHSYVGGWSLANALQREFTTVEGYLVYEKINAVYFAQPFYDPLYLSPVFSSFVLVGVWTAWRRRLYSAVFLTGWAVLAYLFLIGIPSQNIRFPLIIVPAVVVLAGMGIDATLDWLGKQPVLGSSRVCWYAYALVIVFVGYGLAQMLVTGHSTLSQFIANQQRDKQVAQWAREQIPEGAVLYTFGLTLTLKHYTDCEVRELYYETPDSLEQNWIHGQEDYLLADVGLIEKQWRGRAPQTAYHWLRDHRGLLRDGHYDGYTLFRIKG